MKLGEKSLEDLQAYTEKLILKNTDIKGRKGRRNLYDEVENKFGLPISRVEEMISFKRDIKEFTPFEIFCVVWFLDRDSLGKFFTPEEINSFSKEKIEIPRAKFPLIFEPMVEVAPDQWIGSISVKQLMEMKRSQMLNYDENEQRSLRRVKRGEVEIFKPYVSNKNVHEIKESLLAGTYIPDPITLNMGMGEGADFEYKNYRLTIHSLPRGMFNLVDGYHRYLAISQIWDSVDKEFDYPMELRIVNFSNSKANNFIFQQDQKTVMRKIVSATYDTNSVANKVIGRLNEDPTSNLQGMIGRNQAKINAPVLSQLIAYFYKTKSIKREDSAKATISIKKELESKFNLITEQDEIFLGKYDDVMVFVVMWVFNNPSINKEDYATKILSIYNSLTQDERKVLEILSTGRIRKKALSILEEKFSGKPTKKSSGRR